jgi:hypothetical protein
VEVLVILLPLFLVLPVIWVVLAAKSLQAKRREADESKALASGARKE